MKKRTFYTLWGLALALLVLVLVLVNRPGPKVPEGAQPGQRPGDFSLTCLDGSEFTLSRCRGRVVVINLWATWCAPCVKELPNFDRLAREGRAEVLALHSDLVTEDVATWWAGQSYAVPAALDPDGSRIAALDGSTVLPQTIILNPEGIVTYNKIGSLTYEDLSELVDLAAGG